MFTNRHAYSSSWCEMCKLELGEKKIMKIASYYQPIFEMDLLGEDGKIIIEEDDGYCD